MVGRVALDAEVDQREALRLAARDLVDRRVPGLDVDVGRRGGREDVALGLHADPARVAGEQDAVAEVADVVRGVARRRERLPADRVARGDADVRAPARARAPPEAVEVVAEQPARRRLEPRRVDEVRRADLGHPDGQLAGGAARSTRPRPRGRSGCARAAGAGCRSARGRARAGTPRAAAASSPARSRAARGRRRSRPRRRRSRASRPRKCRSSGYEHRRSLDARGQTRRGSPARRSRRRRTRSRRARSCRPAAGRRSTRSSARRAPR